MLNTLVAGQALVGRLNALLGIRGGNGGRIYASLDKIDRKSMICHAALRSNIIIHPNRF